jgi:hypothetical protein
MITCSFTALCFVKMGLRGLEFLDFLGTSLDGMGLSLGDCPGVLEGGGEDLGLWVVTTNSLSSCSLEPESVTGVERVTGVLTVLGFSIRGKGSGLR